MFRVPHLSGIQRSSQIEELRDLIKSSPIVAVEGLSGNGKTFTTSQLLQNHSMEVWRGTPLWHTAVKGETLDTLVNAFSLSAESGEIAARKIMSLLDQSSAVLVIDDYQQVAATSFALLLEVASTYPPPARLIVVSQDHVYISKFVDAVSHFKVQGFGEKEIAAYCKQRRLNKITGRIASRLLGATDGLPLALSVFSSLVQDFNRDPEDLLSGSMLSSERMRRWLTEIFSRCTDRELHLLYGFSLISGPFNEKIGLAIAKKISEAESFSASFIGLINKHLVQKLTSYRWTVHALVREHLIGDRALEHLKTEIVTALGNYHYQPVVKKVLTDPSARIDNASTATRYFTVVDEVKAKNAIGLVIREMKRRGMYPLIASLYEPLFRLDRPILDWSAYHYAQSLVVLGRLAAALQFVESLREPPHELDINLLVSLGRLQAEIHVEMGTADAERILDKCEEAMQGKVVRVVVKSQFLAAKARAYMAVNKFEKAKETVKILIDDARGRQDSTASGVAFMVASLLADRESRLADAREFAFIARECFAAAEDVRGVAWSTGQLGLSQLKTGSVQEGCGTVLEAIKAYGQHGATPASYRQLLEEVIVLSDDSSFRSKVQTELVRISR